MLRLAHLRLNLLRFAEVGGTADGVPGVDGRESDEGAGEGVPVADGALLTPESVDGAVGKLGRFLKTRGIFAPSEVFDTGTGATTVGGKPAIGEGARMLTPGTVTLSAFGVAALVPVTGAGVRVGDLSTLTGNPSSSSCSSSSSSSSLPSSELNPSSS